MRDFLSEHWHDLIAGIVTLVLTIGVLSLVLLEKRVPEFLVGAMGTAMGYTFRSGVSAIGASKARPATRKKAAAA